MPAIHLRTPDPLHDAIVAAARDEGLSLNAYLVRLCRSDIARRAQLALSVGLHYHASDSQIIAALGTACAGRAGKQRAAEPAAAAPVTRAAKPKASKATKHLVLSSAEYGRLLAVRAKRAGKPAPDRQPPPCDYTVRADDADAQAIVAARGAK